MKANFSKPLIWVLVVVILAHALTLWVSAENTTTVTVNWMNWVKPAYSQTYTSGTFPTYFTYANGTTGQLTLPDSTVVTVTLTGEVTDSSCFTSDGCTNNRWASVTAGAYTSANVPSLPPNNDMIVQTGYVNPGHTMTFSQPVQNVVMDIYSLGGVSQSAYTFDQDFEILSQDPRCNPENFVQYCMSKDPNNAKTLIGYEGNGTIQFVGTYSSITWTVSVPEYWSGFNIGVTSAGAPSPSPSPSPSESPSPSPSPSPTPPPDPVCDTVNALTLDEVQWHSNASVSPLTDAWYSAKFSSPFMIGMADRSVTLTSAKAIRNFSPQTGAASVLLSAWVDPTKKLKNDLAGSAMAAKLNLALSPQLTLARLQAVKGVPARFVGYTVKDMVRIADESLGWNGTPSTPPTQAFLDDLNKALIAINNSFPAKKRTGILICSEIG